MYKEKAQEIAFTYIDPDRNEKMAMNLEEDIANLLSDEIRKEEAIWEGIVIELEEKIASLEKRARIVQLANRRYLKKSILMEFKEKKYSFREKNGITHKRVVTGELFTHGQRIYTMKNPENNEDHTGVADEIDEKFLPKKGPIVPKSIKGVKTIDKRLQRSGGKI